jgi:hypothetical protein
MRGNCARCGRKVRSEAAWHGSGDTEGRTKPRAVASDLKSNEQALYVRA